MPLDSLVVGITMLFTPIQKAPGLMLTPFKAGYEFVTEFPFYDVIQSYSEQCKDFRDKHLIKKICNVGPNTLYLNLHRGKYSLNGHNKKIMLNFSLEPKNANKKISRKNTW